MTTLSPTTITTVKATIPVLKEHAVDITSKMYEILFTDYPELKKMFSDAPEDQPRVLAAAVSAYAMNIDNLDALGDAVGKMAASHVRTKVKPEHYPMVGESLLTAMKEVLGDAATPAVLEAWGEAYFFLADILIENEKALYEKESLAVA